MGTCKGCNKVFSSLKIKQGLCEVCFSPDKVEELNKQHTNQLQKFFRKNGVEIGDKTVVIDDITYDLNDIVSAQSYIETNGSWGTMAGTLIIGGVMIIFNTHIALSIFGVVIFISAFFNIPSSAHYLNLAVSGNELTLLYDENENFIDEVVEAINSIKAKSIINK